MLCREYYFSVNSLVKFTTLDTEQNDRLNPQNDSYHILRSKNAKWSKLLPFSRYSLICFRNQNFASRSQTKTWNVIWRKFGTYKLKAWIWALFNTIFGVNKRPLIKNLSLNWKNLTSDLFLTFQKDLRRYRSHYFAIKSVNKNCLRANVFRTVDLISGPSRTHLETPL